MDSATERGTSLGQDRARAGGKRTARPTGLSETQFAAAADFAAQG